jgi:hypothetical protein
MSKSLNTLALGFALVAGGASAFASTADVRFPSRLECQGQKYSELIVIRTGLEKFTSIADATASYVSRDEKDLAADELASINGWWGSYFSSNIQKGRLVNGYWSCDSEDRFYSFELSDLAIDAASAGQTGVVTGMLEWSVRGERELDLVTCTY